MRDFIEISADKIHVNTHFSPWGTKVRLCIHYDRWVCDTLDEYNSLSVKDIERVAYGSWMDGAK